MANQHLNQNVKFQCQNGNAVWFRAQNSDAKTFIQKSGVLLENCSLKLIGPPKEGQCNMLINPSTGLPAPCAAAVISGKWSNITNVKVSGKGVLNSGCSVQCPMLGTIKPFKPTYTSINVDTNASAVSVQSLGTSSANGASKGKVQSDISDSQMIEKNETLIEQDSEKINENETFDDEKKSDNVKYALCDYKNCEKAGECEYLHTPYVLREMDSAGNANELKNNIGRERFDYYALECSDIATTFYGRETYSIAHHHLIPAKECFSTFPELVKLANYYEYDINNAFNGICLPTVKNGYGGKAVSLSEKREIAFTAMKKLGKEWHLGPHSSSSLYNTKKIGKIVDKLFSTRKPLKDYESSVNDLLVQFRNELDSNRKCRCLNKNVETDIFVRTMNHISEKIANKLREFETNPKRAHSFFVSKMAFYYAFYEDLKEYEEIILKD